jgi:hypothetical protein
MWAIWEHGEKFQGIEISAFDTMQDQQYLVIVLSMFLSM